jgi:MFS family permease
MLVPKGMLERMQLAGQEQRSKAGLLAGLYTTQTLGLAFVTTAVPVILRQAGAGLDVISLVFVLGICWSFKFLWAPLIDRYGSRRLGHYRGWIVLLQLLMILATVSAAFFPPGTHLPALAVLLVLISFFSATQDIAADGLSVTILRPEERALGCSIQSAGNMLGFLIGGGVVLLVYQWLGWRVCLFALAVGMALPLWGISRYHEPQSSAVAKGGKCDFSVLLRFFKRPGILHWIAIVLVFRINGQISYWLLSTYLVDLGWSLERIGFVLNIVGLLLGMGGSIFGGVLVERCGRRTAMLATQFMGLLGTVGFIVLLQGAAESISLAVYAVLVLSMIGFGLSFTVVFTVIMDKCDPASAATDFTLQWSLGGLSSMAVAGVSMALAEYVGYTWVLCASVVIAIGALALIWAYDGFEKV